jgi:hypothetical protein
MSDFDKPSKAEDEYFARQEFERRKQWAAERAKEKTGEEKEKAKQLHWMKCPKCGMDLATVDFQGVSIDRCTSCGGTFFDNGEIEEVLKRDTGFLGKALSIFK